MPLGLAIVVPLILTYCSSLVATSSYSLARCLFLSAALSPYRACRPSRCSRMQFITRPQSFRRLLTLLLPFSFSSSFSRHTFQVTLRSCLGWLASASLQSGIVSILLHCCHTSHVLTPALPSLRSPPATDFCCLMPLVFGALVFFFLAGFVLFGQ